MLRVCLVVGIHAVSLTLFCPHDTSCQPPGVFVHDWWPLWHVCMCVSVSYLWLFITTNHLNCNMQPNCMYMYFFLLTSVVSSWFDHRCTAKFEQELSVSHESVSVNMQRQRMKPVSCELVRLVLLKISSPRGEKLVRLPVIIVPPVCLLPCQQRNVN